MERPEKSLSIDKYPTGKEQGLCKKGLGINDASVEEPLEAVNIEMD